MKLKEYRLFGDDKQYKEITFISYMENEITFTLGSGGFYTVETNGASIHEIFEAYEIIQSGVITL